MPGLRPGSKHQLRVRSGDGSGWRPWKTALVSEVLTCTSDVPGPPAAAAATLLYTGGEQAPGDPPPPPGGPSLPSLAVAWAPGPANGAPLEAFELWWRVGLPHPKSASVDDGDDGDGNGGGGEGEDGGGEGWEGAGGVRRATSAGGGGQAAGSPPAPDGSGGGGGEMEPGEGWHLVTTTPACAFTVTRGLVLGQTYTFKVRGKAPGVPWNEQD